MTGIPSRKFSVKRGLFDQDKEKQLGSFEICFQFLGLDLSYNTFAPGWDTTFGDEDNWASVLILAWFILSMLFVLLHSMTAAGCRCENRKRRIDLQNELDDFEWWPLLSAGLVYNSNFFVSLIGFFVEFGFLTLLLPSPRKFSLN